MIPTIFKVAGAPICSPAEFNAVKVKVNGSYSEEINAFPFRLYLNSKIDTTVDPSSKILFTVGDIHCAFNNGDINLRLERAIGSAIEKMLLGGNIFFGKECVCTIQDRDAALCIILRENVGLASRSVFCDSHTAQDHMTPFQEGADGASLIVFAYRNVFSVVAKSKVKIVAKILKAIHTQESKKASPEKAKTVVSELRAIKLKEVAKKVEDGIEETLTYCDFPSEHWTRIRTNNVIERLNREILRRIRMVGIFPDGNSALMLVCARLRHVAAARCFKSKTSSLFRQQYGVE